MKNIALTLLVLVAVSLVNARDFSSFEQSLMDPATPDVTSSDSSNSTNSSNALAEFEKSLVSVPSEIEPIYVCRDQLLAAVEQKNTAQVVELTDKLKTMSTRKVSAYIPFEFATIYTELKMYDRMTDHLVEFYRTVLDTDRFDSNVTVIEDDALYRHMVSYWQSQDSTKAPYELLIPKIDNSKLSGVKRLKLKILSMLRYAYRDPKVGEEVRSLTEEFVEQYPDDPDAPWMKQTILGPLSRMSVWDFKMQKRSELKEDVIRNKFYTGGVGFNLYFWMGGFGLGFDDLYRNDIYEPDPWPVDWEFYLQFGRFTALFELINTGVSGLSSLGWGVGWVVYDSRYLKIRPYFGAQTTFMSYAYKDNYVSNGYNMYRSAGSSETIGMDGDGLRCVLAVNVDFKFVTSYFLASSSKLSSLSFVGKFGVSSIEIDTDVAKGDGYDGFFALGLGIYLW